ncbi:MAG: hypothetical protein ABS68_02820 [Niastella sp. SCN 39-18]|nr:MAG: hypothetical protein ABS68_02820 [Niastella sp. SCN 39-18]OJW09646.1 MAG: hypothetical protein BGO53_07250 [Sphingobacteriales bacterium 39-19]
MGIFPHLLKDRLLYFPILLNYILIKMPKITLRAICIIYLFICVESCQSPQSPAFNNKQDSLAFAQSVAKLYPLEVCPPKGPVTDTAKTTKITSISWPTVLDYEQRYDRNPQIKSPGGDYYQGFSIDTEGWSMLQQQTSIKGLYLRLGQKPDLSYTIMLLGTDANGKIINQVIAKDSLQKQYEAEKFTNFDNLEPCPAFCP